MKQYTKFKYTKVLHFSMVKSRLILPLYQLKYIFGMVAQSRIQDVSACSSRMLMRHELLLYVWIWVEAARPLGVGEAQSEVYAGVECHRLRVGL